SPGGRAWEGASAALLTAGTPPETSRTSLTATGRWTRARMSPSLSASAPAAPPLHKGVGARATRPAAILGAGEVPRRRRARRPRDPRRYSAARRQGRDTRERRALAPAPLVDALRRPASRHRNRRDGAETTPLVLDNRR